MPKKGGLAKKKCKGERATQKLFHLSSDDLLIRLIGNSFKVKEAKLPPFDIKYGTLHFQLTSSPDNIMEETTTTNIFIQNSPKLLPPPNHSNNNPMAMNFKQSRSFELNIEMEAKMKERRMLKRGHTIGKFEGEEMRQKMLMKKNVPMPMEEEEIGKKKEKFIGGRKEEEDEEDAEEFWMDMVGLRTAKFGIGLWCIVWNGIGLFARKWGDGGHFLLFNVLLGFGQIFSGWQFKRIAKKRSFPNLFCHIPTLFIYIHFGIFVMQKNVADLFETIKLLQNGQKWKMKFDGYVEFGNCILMCFVIYSNLIAVRMIFARIGAYFDGK